MKTAYAPDNTRSSIAVMSTLAIVVIAIAVLIGLSDKPDVSTIAISPSPLAFDAVSPLGTADDDEVGDSTAQSDEPFSVSADDEEAAPSSETGNANDPATAADDEADRQPQGEVIPVPTLEPTPTPEVANAVEPEDPVDESTSTEAATGDLVPAPSLPTTSGSVQGEFFTKVDENEGAVVAQNLITVSFSEDGSGAFQGVLDITYDDGSHILLNMSGPLTWAASNPQVEATLSGRFTLDAAIDADNVTTQDAELSITSLGAGSGSLCVGTTKCFGFTFPPQ